MSWCGCPDRTAGSSWSSAKLEKPDLQAPAELLENGCLKPVIDRSYDLAEASDALRTFGEGHVGGKLVLTI